MTRHYRHRDNKTLQRLETMRCLGIVFARDPASPVQIFSPKGGGYTIYNEEGEPVSSMTENRAQYYLEAPGRIGPHQQEIVKSAPWVYDWLEDPARAVSLVEEELGTNSHLRLLYGLPVYYVGRCDPWYPARYDVLRGTTERISTTLPHLLPEGFVQLANDGQPFPTPDAAAEYADKLNAHHSTSSEARRLPPPPAPTATQEQEEEQDKPRHRYYYINRPPAIGCQPAGFVDRAAWMPAQPIPGNEERVALGWVDYEAPLSFDDLYRYELRPAEKVEQARYLFWQEADQDSTEAARMEAEYKEFLISSDPQQRARLIRRNALDEAAWTIVEAEKRRAAPTPHPDKDQAPQSAESATAHRTADTVQVSMFSEAEDIALLPLFAGMPIPRGHRP